MQHVRVEFSIVIFDIHVAYVCTSHIVLTFFLALAGSTCSKLTTSGGVGTHADIFVHELFSCKVVDEVFGIYRFFVLTIGDAVCNPSPLLVNDTADRLLNS